MGIAADRVGNPFIFGLFRVCREASLIRSRTRVYAGAMNSRANPKNIIAAACCLLRMQRGWTQTAMAQECCHMGWMISRGTLAKIETGRRVVDDIEVALLAHVLGATPNELLSCPLEKLISVARHSTNRTGSR